MTDKQDYQRELAAGEYLPRRIEYLVVHCSATRANIPFTEKQLLACHLARGFRGIGYHFYVTKDGVLHETRPMSEVGAHALGFILFKPIYVSCYYNQ